MSTPKLPVQAWVGCYTDVDGDQGLVALSGDSAAFNATRSGKLLSPSWLTPLDPAAGTWLAVSETEDSTVSVVDLSGSDPMVTSTVATHGAHACHVALSPDRRWIGVAHYTSGSVALLAAPGEAGLQPPLDLITFTGGSLAVPDRQETPHAHQIVWLDDVTVLVPDLGTDLIRVLRVETDSGSSARWVEAAPIEAPRGTGPRHLVLRPPPPQRRSQDPLPDVAIVGELSGEVLSYRREDGGWTLVHSTPGSSAPGAQPSGFRVFPDGEMLVVANREVNTVGLLTWRPDGTLVLTDEFGCGGKHPRDVVIHGGGVWVANQHSDSVAAFFPGEAGWQPTASATVRTPACIVFPDDLTLR